MCTVRQWMQHKRRPLTACYITLFMGCLWSSSAGLTKARLRSAWYTCYQVTTSHAHLHLVGYSELLLWEKTDQWIMTGWLTQSVNVYEQERVYGCGICQYEAVVAFSCCIVLSTKFCLCMCNTAYMADCICTCLRLSLVVVNQVASLPQSSIYSFTLLSEKYQARP